MKSDYSPGFLYRYHPKRTNVIVHIQLVFEHWVLQEYRTVQKRYVSLDVYYLHPGTKFINIFIGRSLHPKMNHFI